MTRALSLFLSGAVSSTLLEAQVDEIVRLREEHERTVSAATKMLDDNYRLTLAHLEQQRADQGDYEGALQAQERAEAAAKMSIPSAAAERPGYVLAAAQARTQGALFDRLKGCLEFRKAGAAATWDILRLEPGTYEIFAVYSVGPPTLDAATNATTAVCGGSFSCKEVTSLGSTAAPLEKTVSTTGSWDNYVRASLGRGSFKSKSATLRLEALNASPGGLMRLMRLELTPATGAPLETTLAGKAADELLRDLRRDHRALMTAAVAPVQAKFRGDLEKLAAELTQLGDKEAASAVMRESKRLFPEGTEPLPLEFP